MTASCLQSIHKSLILSGWGEIVGPTLIQKCNHRGEVVTWHDEVSAAWVGRCSRCGVVGYVESEMAALLERVKAGSAPNELEFQRSRPPSGAPARGSN